MFVNVKRQYTTLKSNRYFNAVIFTLLLSLVLTFSRSGFLSMIIAITILYYRKIFQMRNITYIVAIAGVMLTFLYHVSQDYVIFTDISESQLSRIFNSYNYLLRVNIFKSMLINLLSHMDILLFGLLGRSTVEHNLIVIGLPITSHNVYFELIYDFGVIVAAYIVYLWYYTYKLFIRYSKYNHNVHMQLFIFSYLINIAFISDPQGFYLMITLALGLKLMELSSTPNILRHNV